MSDAPIISLRSLSKRFGHGASLTFAVRELSLEVTTGELIALRGPSGSGKSTLLNILGLLDRHDEGELLFRGESLNQASIMRLDQIRRLDIGFVFQNFNLFPVFSAVENVEYPLFLIGKDSKKAVRERAEAALESVGMQDFLTRKPAELSGGQRQRVAIARAIVKTPTLIFADEPSASLDQKNATQIIDLLCSLNQKYRSTVVIATHDDEVSKRTQRTIYLQDGGVLWDKKRL